MGARPPVPLPLGGDARAFVPVTLPGSSEWKTAGGSFPAPRPQRWHERGRLCLASAAALPAPGQAPVLTPLLSPQVVPESGARERERHAAQQAGQVRPSRRCCPVLCLPWDPLVTGKQQLLPGRAAACARHVAGLTCLVQIPFPGSSLLPFPESAESSTHPYAPATGLGWTISFDKLNRILHRSRVRVSPVLGTSRRHRLVQPLASPLLFPWETPMAGFGL